MGKVEVKSGDILLYNTIVLSVYNDHLLLTVVLNLFNTIIYL
jgi:hypothetical protein